MSLPPLPPGFVLDDSPQASDIPPLPPGFVMESDDDAGGSLELDIVGGTPVTAQQFEAELTPQRSFMQEAGRSLGLGGRAMLQGGADLVGIVADPFIHGANALGANQATMRQGANALADRIGLPSPETATERVSGDITGALAGGGGLIGLGRGLAARAPGVVSGVGNMLASQPSTQLASIVGGSGAAGITREAGGGQGAQLASGLAGGVGIPAVKTAASMGLRGLFRGGEGAIDQQTGRATGGRKIMEQNIHDFNAVGATPSVGQATGSNRTQGLESLLAGGPTSGGVMADFAEQQGKNIGGGLQRLADDFMPGASRQRAGEAIESGIETYAGNVRATKNALYWRADRMIPSNTALPLSRTWQTLDALVSPTPGATATTGALVNPKIAAMAKNVADDLAANGGQMPYEAVRALRSRIGAELTDFSLTTDKPTAEYKRLYGALSQDLEEAARRQGPEAERAARKANSYTKRTSERLEHLNRIVNKNGGAEKVYAAAISGASEGNTTLKRIMYAVPKESQQALTAAVVKRMGMARSGAQTSGGDVFSARNFLTNWDKVSPEARRVLFGRHGPKFVESMNKVARVADSLDGGSKVFSNPAGTANRAAAIGYYASLPTTLGAGVITGSFLPFAGTVTLGVGANALARLMTNPKFVNWLAAATEMPISSAAQQAVVLSLIADGDEDMMALSEALKNPPGNPNNDGGSRPN